MKKLILSYLVFCFFCLTATIAVPNRPIIPKSEINSSKVLERTIKEQVKFQKKKGKLVKKVNKIKKKLSKRRINNPPENGSVWEEETFKLGALIALGGLVLIILKILPILGGIIGFIGGLMLLVGLGLMIYTLVKSYE